MHIGIDVRPVQKRSSRRRGIGRYTRQLVESVLKANGSRHQFVLYAQKAEVPTFEGAHELATLFQLSRPGRLAWVPDLVLLRRAIRKSRLDVFHAMDLMAIPKARETAVFLTLHDLIPFIYWEQTRQSVPIDYALALRYALRRVASVDHVITDSVHSKKDICERLQFPEHLVSVVYPGYHAEFGPRDQEAAATRLARSYGLNSPFLFYVGGSDFRKNLAVLIEAFSQIRRLGYGGQLVFAGETFTWDIPEVREIRRRVAEAGLEDRVLYPGFVPDADLPDFYACCDLFVFPSLYEGFGFPVLEALACQAPVIASRSSSIPEVGGDAVEYFEPTEPTDLVRAFQLVFNDADKKRAMVEKGLQRARLFGWDRAGEQLLGLYESHNG